MVLRNLWNMTNYDFSDPSLFLGYRAIGIMEKQTVTWFWVGDHDEYKKIFG